MKKYCYIICIMALLIGNNGFASKVTPEFIDNIQVIHSDVEVTVNMDILLSQLDVKSNETLILTPVISNGGHKVELPAVEIMGRLSYIYYLRNGHKSFTEEPYIVKREVKRSEIKKGIDQCIDYTMTVPFEEWMYGAEVTVVCRQSSCGCSPWGNENLSIASIDSIYRPEYKFSFIEPEPEPVKERSVETSAYINFYVDKYDIHENYKNNKEELDKIIKSVSSIADDPDYSISSITIKGWASPEGNVNRNATLSDNRANALANWLSKTSGIERSRIEAQGNGEDWAGLQACVDSTPGLLNRHLVYDILNNGSLSLDHKEKQLKQLDPPTIYRRIVNEFYPRLRRSDYKIEYQVRNFDLKEAQNLINTNPSKLSLYEMYMVAGSYATDSPEYLNAIETAARTYPQAVPAAINMAALKIQENKYLEALAILTLTNEDDARVKAAKGYINICMGDYATAEEYLNQAAEKGNEDAIHNLAELLKYLKSI